MEPKSRFELETFSLPRKRSTPELLGLIGIDAPNVLLHDSWRIYTSHFSISALSLFKLTPKHKALPISKLFSELSL